ncbi:MAG: hypothetical protein DI637_04740 [Citromicrobium sp.]|nr:MAG: hypothetical protein DI637_04740 [Citromicrobium sp.]
MTAARLLSLALLGLLAACGSEAETEPPAPVATEISEPRTLIAADLDLGTLGARIEGPQGTEVETVLSAGNREIGRMVSFVACPENTERCVPAALPADTVYTYVHRITLAGDAEQPVDDDDAAVDGPEALDNSPSLFRTARKALGFNGAVGYAKHEAASALGNEDAISVSSVEDFLVWTLADGAEWRPGTSVTFWWQSTLPPRGPEEAFLLELDGNQATGIGPFPAEVAIGNPAGTGAAD